MLGVVKASSYNAILVLGTGIRQDGSLPPTSVSSVDKAVQLYRSGVASRIIMSGRWSYNLPFTPPLTEAQAMKRYAAAQSVPEADILVEDESVTTVSNLCLVKQHYLEPHDWKRIILIGIRPHAPRTLYNAQRVLGPDYACDLQLADFQYAPERLAELEVVEQGKLQDAIKFHQNLLAGDHRAIYDAAMADLQEHYINKSTA